MVKTSLVVGAGLVSIISIMAVCAQAQPAPEPRPAPGPIARAPSRPLTIAASGGTCAEGVASNSGQAGNFAGGRMVASLSHPYVLAGEPSLYAAIDLSTDAIVGEKRPALSLAIVIDRSGSMSGDKIVQARAAAKGIISRLNEGDAVSLVQYDDTAEVVVPLIAMTDAGKKRLAAAIDNISDRGGTNLHGGMVLGRDQIAGAIKSGNVNRVILLSDGLANVGVTDPSVIASVAGTAADRGIRITTVGVGDDYNEDLMETIAESGRGAYYYVQRAADLESVFAREISSLSGTIASNVELTLEPLCAGVAIEEIYGYAAKRDGNRFTISLPDLFGNDSRKAVIRFSNSAQTRAAVKATLRFKHARTGAAHSVTSVLTYDITSNTAQVDGAVNRDVMAKVEQAETAKSIREAMVAYEKGNAEEARKMIATQKATTQQRASKYGYDKDSRVQELEASAEKLDDAIQAAPAAASDEGKAMRKASKAAAGAMSKQN
ncbi:MAG: VWA domain-containing protein [Myxococcales bacterium]|nr:VWA domain-containing protein [Myxococcales bacterium]